MKKWLLVIELNALCVMLAICLRLGYKVQNVSEAGMSFENNMSEMHDQVTAYRNDPPLTAEALERNEHGADDGETIPVYRFARRADGTALEPRLLSVDERQQLEDPWFQGVLLSPSPPLRLQAILDKMAEVETRFALNRVSFLVGEGSQIPVTPQFPIDRDRRFRFILAWTHQGVAQIFLGTRARTGFGFLEVLAWDPDKRAFNYYERKAVTGSDPIWMFAGDSSDALKPGTRGTGCFRCHINGGPVMRELQSPWNNWHSQSVLITTTVPREIRFEQPRRTLFRQIQGAERLEVLVRNGIERWDNTRVERMVQDGMIRQADTLLRQLFLTTTANVATSQTKSDRRLTTQSEFIDLPLSFFINVAALRLVLAEEGATFPRLDTRVARSKYEAALARIGSTLFGEARDSFFAFIVPEPSEEDLSALKRLLNAGLITPKFAASVLMVDFPNPVYSKLRAQLFENVAMITNGTISNGTSDLTAQMVRQIEAQATEPIPSDPVALQSASPQAQFLHYFRMPDDRWRALCRREIETYFKAVRARLESDEGAHDYLRLAVSRRQQFAARPPGMFMVQEAPLLFPSHQLGPLQLDMGVDGRPRRQQ